MMHSIGMHTEPLLVVPGEDLEVGVGKVLILQSSCCERNMKLDSELDAKISQEWGLDLLL